MAATSLTLRCNAAPIEAAMASLADLAERSPELVHGFLDGIDAATQLVRVEIDVLSAAGAGECRTVLHPSNALAELLAAAGAGDVDGS